MKESKARRLEEFLHRLRELPPAADFEEARRQIERTIDEVEDQMSGIPFDHPKWRVDGRLYPPQADSERPVADMPGVRRFRTKDHNVFIGSNGAMQIRRSDGLILLSKAGADGTELGGL